MNNRDIRSMTEEELRELLAGYGEKPYRAAQIFGWLHAKKAVSFGEMTNIPEKLRSRLREDTELKVLQQSFCQISEKDGTRKYAWVSGSGSLIESVFMQYEYGYSACISSQIGCRMGCRFCASTIDGLERSLTAGEMLGQIYAMERDTGSRITHIVIMGMGEPLDN